MNLIGINFCQQQLAVNGCQTNLICNHLKTPPSFPPPPPLPPTIAYPIWSDWLQLVVRCVCGGLCRSTDPADEDVDDLIIAFRFCSHHRERERKKEGRRVWVLSVLPQALWNVSGRKKKEFAANCCQREREESLWFECKLFFGHSFLSCPTKFDFSCQKEVKSQHWNSFISSLKHFNWRIFQNISCTFFPCLSKSLLFDGLDWDGMHCWSGKEKLDTPTRLN